MLKHNLQCLKHNTISANCHRTRRSTLEGRGRKAAISRRTPDGQLDQSLLWAIKPVLPAGR